MLNLDQLIQLAASHREALEATVKPVTIGNREFDFNRQTGIMGVINLSPDSWYRESVCQNTEHAVQRAVTLFSQGADLIDIGAESTLPHAQRCEADSQIQQLSPILKELDGSNIPVSIETYEPEVANAVLDEGAALINFTGNKTAEATYRIVAEHQAAVIICHVQGNNVREVEAVHQGDDPIPLLQDYFEKQIALADQCGVQNILIDPGLGFYYENLPDGDSRVRFQMEMFLNTFRLRTLGVPVCHALPHAFDYFREEVRSAEPFFAVLAALGQTDLLRTHEVPKVVAVKETLGVWEQR